MSKPIETNQQFQINEQEVAMIVWELKKQIILMARRIDELQKELKEAKKP